MDASTLAAIRHTLTIAACIRVTAATPSTVTLLDGATTIQAFAGVIAGWPDYPDFRPDGKHPVWLFVDGETPAVGTLYTCRFLGSDQDGLCVWAPALEG